MWPSPASIRPLPTGATWASKPRALWSAGTYRLGTGKANRITLRHGILNRFFVDVLGVDKVTAEKDACLVEHYISPATMEKLVAFLESQVGYDE